MHNAAGEGLGQVELIVWHSLPSSADPPRPTSTLSHRQPTLPIPKRKYVSVRICFLPRLCCFPMALRLMPVRQGVFLQMEPGVLSPQTSNVRLSETSCVARYRTCLGRGTRLDIHFLATSWLAR